MFFLIFREFFPNFHKKQSTLNRNFRYFYAFWNFRLKSLIIILISTNKSSRKFGFYRRFSQYPGNPLPEFLFSNHPSTIRQTGNLNPHAKILQGFSMKQDAKSSK